MLLKLCSKCGAATQNYNAICDQCAERLSAMQRERHAGYDKHRDPVKVAFYRSRSWRALRRKKLESIGYRCEECVREWQAGLRREEDIQLATGCRRPVSLCNRVGGMIPSPDQVLESIRKAAKGEN